MSHLGSFRKGWEGENLARFILYKFSFVAHPSTVADDVGSDFFCTLFEVNREGRHDYLLPRNSFAIQVKSSADRFDVSDKLQYLANLEIPFFVGVVDRQNLKLIIYSGEYIPALFSYKGVPKKLEIEPCERSLLQRRDDYFDETEEDSYILKFPKVVEIEATAAGDELRARVEALRETSSLIYENIASKRNGQFIFKEYEGGIYFVTAFAGPTSIRFYKKNLVDRLAEAFVNLKWIYEKRPDQFNEQEFRAYESFFRQLEGLEAYRPLPKYINIWFQKLKDLIDGN